jgi:hypothetical protein
MARFRNKEFSDLVQTTEPIFSSIAHICNENLCKELRWKVPADLNAWGNTIDDFKKLIKEDKKTKEAII